MGKARKQTTTVAAVIAGVIIGVAGVAAWASGDLNPGFAGSGAVNIDFANNANDSLQVGFQNPGDQSLLLAGREHKPGGGTSAVGFITRLSSNGSLVNNTKITADLSTEVSRITGVSVPAAGTVFFSGVSGTALKLVRTGETGTITGRYTATSTTVGSGDCRNVITQTDSKAAVSCSFNSASTGQFVGIVRLNTATASFTVDTPGFGANGIAAAPRYTNYSVAVPPSANSNLLKDAAGNFYQLAIVVRDAGVADAVAPAKSFVQVTKFGTNGLPVSGFGSGGAIAVLGCNADCSAQNVDDFQLDSSGGLIIVSTRNNTNGTRSYQLIGVDTGTGVTSPVIGLPSDNTGVLRPAAVLPTANGIYILRQFADVIRLKNDGSLDSGYAAFGTNINSLNRKATTDFSSWYGIFKLDDGNALLLGGVSEAGATTTSSQATVAKFRFAADEVPDGFGFTALINQPTNTLVTSNATTITGISVPVAISVSGGGGSAYSVGCTATFVTTPGTIGNNQNVCVRHTTAAAGSTTTTTLTVGGVVGTFTSATIAPPDTSPDNFAFTAQTGVALNAPITSNTVTIGGINTAAPISITGGTYSIECNGTFTNAAATINNGAKVCVRVTSAAASETLAATTLTIGDKNATFNVTTAKVGLAVNPQSLDFGSINVGLTTAPKTVAVSNTGPAVPIPTITVGADYIVDRTACPDPLPTGGSCTISVSFKPTANGARNGTLQITPTGAPALSVALTGQGILRPVIALNPPSLVFEAAEVTTTSAPKSTTLSNTGNASLTIASIIPTAEFALSVGGTCAVGTPVAAGGSCTINVVFKPVAGGSRTGSVSIMSNAGSPISLGLSGTGISQVPVSLLPASLSFSEQAIGSTSSAKTVTLSNTPKNGNQAAVAVGAVTVSGDFVVTENACPASLPLNESCDISVGFKPTAIGARSGSLTLASNPQAIPSSIALSGTGVATPLGGLLPTSLGFDSRNIGTTSDPKILTLSNTGAASLVYEVVTQGDFTADTSQCPNPLPPTPTGSSCSIKVQFTPAALGVRTGSITLTTNDGQAPLVANLTGGGLSSATVQTSGGPVTLTASRGVVSDFSVVDAPSNVLADYTYPVGFVSFTITGLPTDAPATVSLSMTLPLGAEFNTYVKCKDGVCAPLAGADVNGRVLTITLTDNDPAVDGNGALGTIVDPGAPAFTGTSSGSGGGGGGGAMTWWALLLMGLPVLARRRWH